MVVEVDQPFPAKPVSQDIKDGWGRDGNFVRACALLLDRFHDPRPEALLAHMDRLYPSNKLSIWSRNSLRASAEHLEFLAEALVPREKLQNVLRVNTFRPHLLLARAGLEASAQAIWPLGSSGPEECLSRFIGLMRNDFKYHKDALEAGGEDTSWIDQRISALNSFVQKATPPIDPSGRPRGYEQLVRHAALAAGKEESEWAYYWKAASGAAHGQNWFGLEGYEITPLHEYEPGFVRAAFVPDPAYLSRTFTAAAQALYEGTSRWLNACGYPVEVLIEAAEQVRSSVPK